MAYCLVGWVTVCEHLCQVKWWGFSMWYSVFLVLIAFYVASYVNGDWSYGRNYEVDYCVWQLWFLTDGVLYKTCKCRVAVHANNWCALSAWRQL